MNYLIAHLVGDYLIQNDWMALNKKKSSFVCFVHSITYLIPFLFLNLTWWQILLIGSQHFIQDRTNFVSWFMEIKGSKLFRDNMSPWSIIITDNTIHLLFIFLII